MKNVKKVLSILLVITLFASMTTQAFAATSGKKTATVYGYTYSYYSEIQAMSGSVSFGTGVNPSQSTPATYIGEKAQVYTSTGDLKEYSDWEYSVRTTSKGKPIGVFANYAGSTSKYYYSKGQVQFYNGNGYTTYTCNKSPNAQPTSGAAVTASTGETDDAVVDEDLAVIQTNANGETYGSEYFAEQCDEELDLISAVGVNGKTGYVRNEDLNLDVEITTPEEAMEYMETLPEERLIPVYDEDGETIIDEFRIVNTGVVELED